MDYKQRMKQKKLLNNIKRAIYLDIIQKAFEDNYDSTTSVEKIKLITTVTEHGKLPNRFES